VEPRQRELHSEREWVESETMPEKVEQSDVANGDEGGSSPMSSFLISDPPVLEEVNAWDESHVSEWLRSINCGKYDRLFESNNINGVALLECNMQALKELGVSNVGDRIRIAIAMKAFRSKCYAPLKAARAAEMASFVSVLDGRDLGYEVPSIPYLPSATVPESPTDPSLLSAVYNRSEYFSHPGSVRSTSPSTPGSRQATPRSAKESIMSIDNVKQNCVRFIGNGGTTRIVNIQGSRDAESILRMALKKFGINEQWSDYCVFVTTDLAGQSSAKCLMSGELVSICHSPVRPERERLILRKKNSAPSVEEFRRALDISREQQQQEQHAAISNNVNTKLRKLETFFGERPEQQHEWKSESKFVSNVSSRESRGPAKRLRQFFGQRPPSELISSNLAEYFPGHEKEVLEETVRNSILRRSMRMSMANPRFSTATTASAMSSMRELPPPPLPKLPMPSVGKLTLDGISHGLGETKNEDHEKTLLARRATQIEATAHDRTSSFPTEVQDSVGEIEGVEGDQGPTRWIKGALIGSGSFGSVWLGMNAFSGELMAVKQVELPRGEDQRDGRKQAMVYALRREVTLLMQIQHENIVSYLGSNSDTTHLNIFLEYVPGGTVSSFLITYGAFEEPLIRNFLRQILCGLIYLHDQDIIHRDIKGANVLVDNKGGIKISDFGISKKTEAGMLSVAGTNRASLQGSVYWMAPEVVKQSGHSLKADVWSLGCLVVEMFTGVHPFPNSSQMQAIFQIGQSAAPEIPVVCTADGKDFLTQTFDLDQHRRPSARELATHAFLSEIGPV